MDALFAIAGPDFVVMVADNTHASSIVKVHGAMDKIRVINEGGVGRKMVGAGGPIGDVHQFCDFVERNMYLYQLKSGMSLSTHAAASWIRRELATAIRKGPYQVSLLIAGVDMPGDGEVKAGADASVATPSLYWTDYIGNSRKVTYGAHGYCAYFIMSTFDRYYREGLSVMDALDICKKCIAEIKERFIMDCGSYTVKLVDKDGVRVINLEDGSTVTDASSMDTAA